MALLDRIRKLVRITANQVPDVEGRNPGEEDYIPTYSSPFDEELTMLINAAKRDLARVGIRKELVYAEDIGADVEQCISLYVKQNFGYDNAEADRFGESYRMAVIDIMSSPANASTGALPEEPSEEPTEEPEDEDDTLE